MLIMCALIITSMQLVYEEKFVNKHNIPALKAVGWEGKVFEQFLALYFNFNWLKNGHVMLTSIKHIFLN